MVRRVQINENVELHELLHEDNGQPLAAGKFALYSVDKKEFLKINGKPIELSADNPLTLVLPANNSLTTLDLTPKHLDGKPANTNLLVAVENHGKTIELTGDNLAVMGNATISVTKQELAALDAAKLKDGKVDVLETGTQNGMLNDAEGLNPAPGLMGNVLRYNGKSVAALEFGFGGRVDFLDKNDPNASKALLMLNSGDDQGRTRGRVMQMQNNVMESFADASKLTDPAERKTAFVKLGVPEKEAATLKPGTYTPAPWLPSPADPLYPAEPTSLEEDTRMRKKPTPLPDMEMEVPDNRKLAALDIKQEKSAPSSPSQQEFDDILSRGLDPQTAYHLARMNAKHHHADHNSIQVPDVPGAGGAKNR
jgi:hypothetical protein